MNVWVVTNTRDEFRIEEICESEADAKAYIKQQVFEVNTTMAQFHDPDEQWWRVKEDDYAIRERPLWNRPAETLQQVGEWCDLHGLCEMNTIEGLTFENGTPLYVKVRQ